MLLSNSVLVGSRFSVVADATSYWEAPSKVPKVGKPSAVKPIILASHMVLDLACYFVHSASNSSYVQRRPVSPDLAALAHPLMTSKPANVETMCGAT
jgi:hypothetical protein